MSEHYYTAAPTAAHDLRTVKVTWNGLTVAFDTDAGVFSKDDLDIGTRALLDAAEVSGRILDLGCGWGPVGIFLKKQDPTRELVLTDVNTRAADLARKNARRCGVDVTVVSGDGFEAVEGTFDHILTNPPIRAGKETIYRFFAESKEHLNSGGILWIVIRKQQGAPSAVKYLESIGFKVTKAAHEKGFWVLKCE